MPRCCMDDCNGSTPKVRGVAAADGWIVVDLHGPKGNRYANICPEHEPGEAREKINELISSVTGDD